LIVIATVLVLMVVAIVLVYLASETLTPGGVS